MSQLEPLERWALAANGRELHGKPELEIQGEEEIGWVIAAEVPAAIRA